MISKVDNRRVPNGNRQNAVVGMPPVSRPWADISVAGITDSPSSLKPYIAGTANIEIVVRSRSTSNEGNDWTTRSA
jgi:hypothetical protein